MTILQISIEIIIDNPYKILLDIIFSVFALVNVKIFYTLEKKRFKDYFWAVCYCLGLLLIILSYFV